MRSSTERKKKNEKLKELKARLNFEGCSETSRGQDHQDRDRKKEACYSRYTESLSESEDNGGGHWKSRSKRRNQAERRTTCLNYGCVKKQIPSHIGFATSISQKRECPVTLRHMMEVKIQRNI
nr:hypothetical protein [Tanacetum cinerariifolium]